MHCIATGVMLLLRQTMSNQAPALPHQDCSQPTSYLHHVPRKLSYNTSSTGMQSSRTSAVAVLLITAADCLSYFTQQLPVPLDSAYSYGLCMDDRGLLVILFHVGRTRVCLFPPQDYCC